ncbi:pyridoxamine 5-phosphate oxidase [Halorubrum persicum]|uniref:Pyridoxamine 5-phosphate oxidase n=1 Tax=Halorubrum persicum TaxID=1383844 RepID=A0A2G1WNL4_9EURY|nr:pyridoxamine 5'-phosphate oxidase family protein [Halorubrum persicum]PHQ40566.1 pyridoxamine 5-phosphate oxidase [Halorubrum persicum]
MATRSEVEMSDAEVDALLSRHETGVLSLARDETPYAIPISYGFDEESRHAFLRLVSTPDSEKRKFLASTPQARIVVYEEGGERDREEYASVVGVGTLHRVDLDDLTPESIAQYGEARRPLFEIWAEGKADLDIELYRFEPERLTGRTVVVDRDEE